MSSISTEAATKLNDSGWRRKSSWWVWVPIVSCGIASFVGFVVAGVRFQERRYWTAAAISGAGVALGFALVAIDNNRNTVLADLGTGVLLITMVGSAIAAAVWNRDYLIKLAERDVYGNRPYASPAAAPASQGFLGVDNTQYYAPAPATTPSPQAPPPSSPPPAPSYRAAPETQSVDINRATAEELVAALAVSSDVAARVVQGRSRRGSYSGLDDLASGAGLQPHELVRFRNRVTFGGQHPPPSRPAGRVLDF